MITSYKSLENRFSSYLLLPTDLYDSAWVNRDKFLEAAGQGE